MKASDGLRLAACVALCEAAGALGGLATSSSVASWYLPLVAKPTWAPPSWLFGPVWVTLYAMMGVALFLVWQRRAAEPAQVRTAVAVFLVHLAFNVAWSFAFFAARSPGLGVVVILLLLVLIGATMWAFARVSRPAAWLLVPYLAWVLFATLLNVAIWRLN